MDALLSKLLPLLTAPQMAALDRRTIEEIGVPDLVLMESAALACLAVLLEMGPERLARGTLIVCGPGNNGADGLALARRLHILGHPVVCALLAPPDELRGASAHQVAAAQALQVPIAVLGSDDSLDSLPAEWTHFGLCVDALFGTGLARPIENKGALAVSLLAHLRRAGLPLLAVDIPSGICGSRGLVRGCAVEADCTVTFAAPKMGHFLEPGRSHSGDLVVADIGIPVGRWPDEIDKAPRLLDAEVLVQAIGEPSTEAHKGTFGHVLVVAGSPGKAGAARLCAEAALRAGAGLVTLALPDGLDDPVLHEITPEIMVERVPSAPNGGFGAASIVPLLALAEDKEAVAVGPGLGTGAETVEAVSALLRGWSCPAVVDADALNCLALSDLGDLGSGPRVLTPHPGELKRLIGGQVLAQDGRLAAARHLADRYSSAVVLKGAGSLVAEGPFLAALNPTGNPGLATAGTGDVLTGIVAALLARGMPSFHAACAAVYWHGLAGDLAAEAFGTPSLIAGDLAAALGPAWQLVKTGGAPSAWRRQPNP